MDPYRYLQWLFRHIPLGDQCRRLRRAYALENACFPALSTRHASRRFMALNSTRRGTSIIDRLQSSRDCIRSPR
ncbi:hypothetical protein [Paraburkholderia youngii]|uniref:hypothetical protein n=1 Tax=Paraburkholderia youngii TaxID=2782701 RepID=UPI003D216AA8